MAKERKPTCINGGIFADARRANGWTLKEVESRTGIQSSAICRLEKNRSITSADMVIKLMILYRLNLKDVYSPVK